MDKTQKLLDTQKLLAPPAGEAAPARRSARRFGAVRRPKNEDARRGSTPAGGNAAALSSKVKTRQRTKARCRFQIRTGSLPTSPIWLLIDDAPHRSSQEALPPPTHRR